MVGQGEEVVGDGHGRRREAGGPDDNSVCPVRHEPDDRAGRLTTRFRFADKRARDAFPQHMTDGAAALIGFAPILIQISSQPS